MNEDCKQRIVPKEEDLDGMPSDPVRVEEILQAAAKEAIKRVGSLHPTSHTCVAGLELEALWKEFEGEPLVKHVALYFPPELREDTITQFKLCLQKAYLSGQLVGLKLGRQCQK